MRKGRQDSRTDRGAALADSAGRHDMTEHGSTTWHGWAMLDSSTFGHLLAADTEALRLVWDASQRITSPSPTRRDGSHDDSIGSTERNLAAQDSGHAVTRWDAETAALTDEWDVIGWDEWSDDTVTCWASVRLTMGEALALKGNGSTGRTGYVSPRFVGSATGEPTEVRRLRTAALRDAQEQATAARTAARAATAVIGRDDDARSAGWADAETYRALRGAVMRHTYGNAAKRDRATGAIGAQHVRAGIAGHGITVDVHAVDDATQYAALILRRWVTDGMPDSLATIVAEADTDSACRALIGAAARDGLRMTTQHKRPTALAAQRAAYAARTTARTDDAPMLGNAAPVRLGSKGHTTGRGWVAASTDSLRTDALLARLSARDRAGKITHPSLLALFLSDGNVDDALRSLGRIGSNGRPSGSARRTFLAACRAEWDALTDGTTADDSAEWVDGLTYAR